MKIFWIFFSLILLVDLSFTEEQNDVFRIGIGGLCGFTKIDDLNNLAKAWLNAKTDSTSSNILPSSNSGVGIPFNIEYGFQPFFVFTLWKYWEVGWNFDCSYLAQLYSSMSRDTIKIDMKTYLPTVTTALRLGSFEIGGGLLYGITSVSWNDNFFGYNSKWSSTAWGYELKAGLTSSWGRFVGYNFSIGYRSLVFENVFDNAGRILYMSDTDKRFKLDMSGLVINTGLCFAYTPKKGGSK